MELNEKICINCSNSGFDNVRQHFCALTDLPIAKDGTCENYKNREVIKVPKKSYLSSNKWFIILFLISICIPTFKYIKSVNRKNEAINRLDKYKVNENQMIEFDGFHAGEDKDGFKAIKAIYYTRDTLCTYERFEQETKRHLYDLPDTLVRYDTVYFSHMLIGVHPDTSFVVLHQKLGYSIKQYINRRYEGLE